MQVIKVKEKKKLTLLDTTKQVKELKKFTVF